MSNNTHTTKLKSLNGIYNIQQQQKYIHKIFAVLQTKATGTIKFSTQNTQTQSHSVEYIES